MNVTAIIVTYGNRFYFLKQSIKAAFTEGVKKIIVVDNGSPEENKQKLQAYEKQNNKIMKVLYLNDNYGSAGGYKRGLQEAYVDKECEYIWLLDDDNVPSQGALKELISVWTSLEIDKKEETIALLSRREGANFSYKEELMAYIKNDPEFFSLIDLKPSPNHYFELGNPERFQSHFIGSDKVVPSLI
jgi:glycosyltransferase involved in cell wall biosynthesis